jgi:cytochrome c-type biogenesis protein CcmH
MRARAFALGIALAIMTALHALPAHAVQPDEILPDAKLEERARNLSRELRCMVCQNQSIDDSDAPLARDLRLLVRERLTAGDSDKQVLDFLTTRYGDFVLLNPPMNAKTFLLWVLPASLLFLGGIVLLLAIRRRGAVGAGSGAPTTALSAEEERRIAALLDTDQRTKR